MLLGKSFAVNKTKQTESLEKSFTPVQHKNDMDVKSIVFFYIFLKKLDPTGVQK